MTGDGFVRCADGQRRWGRYGAAGLLLCAPASDGNPTVLLQHRARWSQHGGTWGIPGGARESHETPTAAALRETYEETGIAPAHVEVRSELVVAPAGDDWTYTTVIARTRTQLPLRPRGESADLRWVNVGEVCEYRLHPGFRATWPDLRLRLRFVGLPPVGGHSPARPERSPVTPTLAEISLPEGPAPMITTPWSTE